MSLADRPPDTLLAPEDANPGATMRAFWQVDAPPDVTPVALERDPGTRVGDLPPIVLHDPADWATREDAGLPVLPASLQGSMGLGELPPRVPLHTPPVMPLFPPAAGDPLPTPEKPPLPPDAATLSIDGVLGEGGSGRVLLARQHSLDREVAVKVPRRSESFLGPALIAEARLAGKVEHPNVVPVHGLHRTQDGSPAMVMKRIRGVAWEDLFQDPYHRLWERFPLAMTESAAHLERHLEILVAVAHAVSAAHRAGIVHRDIKPANVMVAGPDEVYLTDWGLAMELAHRRNPGDVTALVGTPAFMAPEMALGEQALIDERTDVYQLGATLHYILSGRYRNPGMKARDMVDRLRNPSPCVLPPTTPPGLAAICERATAYAKADRFPSAQAFIDAIRGWFRARDAERMAARASERLRKLEDKLARSSSMLEADHDRAFRLAIECQTAFEDALQLAPEDKALQAEHRRFLERWVTYLIDADELATARAFLADWPDTSDELRQRVLALETRARAREERQSRLIRLERDLDPGAAANARRKLFMLGLLYAVAAWIVTFAVIPRFISEPLQRTAVPIAISITTNTLFWLGVFIGRRQLMKNAVSRRIIGFLGLLFGAVFVHRLVALLVLELPVTTTTALECLVQAMLSGLAAVTLSRAFWPAPLIGLAGLGVSILWPDRAPMAYGLTIVGTLILAALVWGRADARSGPLEPR